MPLSFEEIKSLALPVVAHEVALPEFGEGKSVFVGELTAWERETRVEAPFRARKEATGDEGGLRAMFVAACLCKNAGREFMAVEQQLPQLAETLMQWPLKAFDRLFKACETYNGLSDEAQKELEKN